MSLTPTDFITQLLEHTGAAAGSFDIKTEEDISWLKINITIPEEESGILIGVHGETLSSLQRITRLAYLSTMPDIKIIININDYRQRREEKLRGMVDSIAERVRTSGQSHTLPSYLPSYERFFIHTMLSGDKKYEELESVSSGIGRDRRLTIQLKP